VALRDDTAFCAAAGLSKSTKPYPAERGRRERERKKERKRKSGISKDEIKADD